MATFTLYLPDKLVAEMDSLRGSRSRSGWIRDAVEIALGVPPKKLHAQVGRVYPPNEEQRSRVLDKRPLQRPIIQKRH